MHNMQTCTRKIWVKMLAVKGAVNDLKCCFVFGCLIVRLQQKVAFSPTTFGLCSQSSACFCQPTNEFIFILIEHLSYEFKSGLYPTIRWALGRHCAQCNWIMVPPVKMHQTCMNTRVSILVSIKSLIWHFKNQTQTIKHRLTTSRWWILTLQTII